YDLMKATLFLASSTSQFIFLAILKTFSIVTIHFSFFFVIGVSSKDSSPLKIIIVPMILYCVRFYYICHFILIRPYLNVMIYVLHIVCIKCFLRFNRMFGSLYHLRIPFV